MKKQIKIAYFPSTTLKSVVLSSNGKSLDKYCTVCTTEEDLSSGNYILDGTFLIQDNIQDILQEEVILKVLMDYGEEIFRISKVSVGTRYIDIVARQITIADELTLWLEDVRPTVMNGASACDYLLTNSTGTKEIQIFSDIDIVSTAYYPKMSLYKALHDTDQSFLNRWGGEIQRRGYIEYINTHIGISRGVTIREGKNLTGFTVSSNIDALITRAQGKGYNGILGSYIDSPIINNYNRIYTSVIEYTDVKVIDENNTEGYTTLALAQAELNRRIQNEYDINGIDKIKASYAINFVQLEKTEEYKNYVIAERIFIGDTIGVYVPRLKVDIQVRAMVKKFDVLAQKTEEITLSNFIEVKPLTIQQIIEKLEEMDSTENILQQAKDNATDLIKSGLKNSFVVVRANEIIIGDTNDINTMTKLWRWNNGGLGYSSTGYYGTFGTAITSDGAIVADFITAGVLSGNIIKGGTITGCSIQQTMNDVVVNSFTNNAYGGLTVISDVNGNQNAVIGVESGDGNNVGGSLTLKTDGNHNSVMVGASQTKKAGFVSLVDAGGTTRISISAQNDLNSASYSIRDINNVEKSYLTETQCVANGEVLASQVWVNQAMASYRGNFQIWTGTIALGNSMAITHNLGRAPIVDISCASVGNYTMTHSNGSMVTTVYNSPISGGDWTGSVRLY